MRYLTFQIAFNAIKSILDVAFLPSSLVKEEMAVSGPQRASLLLHQQSSSCVPFPLWVVHVTPRVQSMLLSLAMV